VNLTSEKSSSKKKDEVPPGNTGKSKILAIKDHVNQTSESSNDLSQDPDSKDLKRELKVLQRQIETLISENQAERERKQEKERGKESEKLKRIEIDTQILELMVDIRKEAQVENNMDQELYKHQIQLLAAQLQEKESQLKRVCAELQTLAETAKGEKLMNTQLINNLENERVEKDNIKKELNEFKFTLANPDGKDLLTIDMKDIEQLTNRFANDNLIGIGNFGEVYKGVLRRIPVAVKRLNKNLSKQHSDLFRAHLSFLSSFQHPYLDQWILHSKLDEERPCLISYLSQQGNLRDRLDCKDKTPPIPWVMRIKITWQIVLGLLYLHSPYPSLKKGLFHLNLKSNNILLFNQYDVKLADYGLVDIFGRDAFRQAEFSIGFICPEFLASGKVTEKTDIYSVGVIMGELLTGRPSVQRKKGGRPAYLALNLRDLIPHSKASPASFPSFTSSDDLALNGSREKDKEKSKSKDGKDNDHHKEKEADDHILNNITNGHPNPHINGSKPSKIDIREVDPNVKETWPVDNFQEYGQIMRDCLDMNPDLRPSINELLLRLEKLMQGSHKLCLVCVQSPPMRKMACGHDVICSFCAQYLLERGDGCPLCRAPLIPF